MALTSFLKYSDSSLQITYGPGPTYAQTIGVNKVSAAVPKDLQFYDRAAYRRIEQVVQSDQTFEGDQDLYITSTLFPKASIELLNLFEFGWWPLYVERTLGSFYYKQNQTNPGAGMTMTAFEPAQLAKQNQTLIQLEVYKAIEIFYSTLVTDNSNINEKDAKNHYFAKLRFEQEWEKAIQGSYFYDQRNTGFIGTYQQGWLADPNAFDGDRRYF